MDGRRVVNVRLVAAGVSCALASWASPVARQAAPTLPAGHQQMVELLRQVADETPDLNPYIGDLPAREARAALQALSASTPDATRWALQMRLAQEELRIGNEADAIGHLTDARWLLTRTEEQLDRTWEPITLFALGVAYMRLGETENCAAFPTPHACILPLDPEAIHQLQEGSQGAIAAFSRALETTDRTSPLHLATRWLLNIAHMTLGTYPVEVPELYVIPRDAFESDEKIPRFTNIAPRLGLDTFDMAGGAIADDFDNDGYLDLVVSTWDPQESIRVYRNARDGTFVDRTAEAGVAGITGGLNLVQADYDNDGYLDVFVLRGAWLGHAGRHPNSLLHNNGDGTFTDVTFEAGLGRVHYPTQTASWGDYDNDGDLDLYVGNETEATLEAPSQLFRNNGDSTFTDVAQAAGVNNDRFTKAVVWGDYDGDRFSDLYISNNRGHNRLYRNNRDGTFTDVAEELGVTAPTSGIPAWFWDVDNDGTLDLFAAAYAAEIADLAADALGLPFTAESARLYRGTGDGRFSDVSARYNLTRPTAPMGSNFGDLDNDGYLDFYLGTGYPHYQNLMPNVMYRNVGGRRFADVSAAGGFAHLQKGHAVVFADFDHDGDQDVFEQMGGAFPGDRFFNAFYENPGFGNHWITIKLVGVHSNRSAIGARIRVVVVEDGERRSIYKHVNSGGSFGGSPLRQTVGLGQALVVETLEVLWPTSGATQTFSNVPVDRAIRIVEGESSFTPLTLETLALGRDARP